MKKLLLLVCITGLLFSCDIRNTRNNFAVHSMLHPHFDDSTQVKMIDSVYDFGKVIEGTKVVYEYRFKNTGSKPLIVSSATASCGCTVPEKPEEPVRPGETGVLKVVFNSSDRPGPAHKTIQVVSNAFPGFPILVLTGEVEKK